MAKSPLLQKKKTGAPWANDIKNPGEPGCSLTAEEYYAPSMREVYGDYMGIPRLKKSASWIVTVTDGKKERTERVNSPSYKGAERAVTPKLRQGETIKSMTIAHKKAKAIGGVQECCGAFVPRHKPDCKTKEKFCTGCQKAKAKSEIASQLRTAADELVVENNKKKEDTGDYDFYKADPGSPAGEEEWIAMKEMGIIGRAKNAAPPYDRLLDLCNQFVRGTISNTEFKEQAEAEGAYVGDLAFLEQFDGSHRPEVELPRLAKKLFKLVTDPERKRKSEAHNIQRNVDRVQGQPTPQADAMFKASGRMDKLRTRTQPDQEHPGAVCSECGRTVTEGEYSYGGSTCCNTDVVAEEQYGMTASVRKNAAQHNWVIRDKKTVCEHCGVDWGIAHASGECPKTAKKKENKEDEEGAILQQPCPLCGHVPVYREAKKSGADHKYYCHACNRGFDEFKAATAAKRHEDPRMTRWMREYAELEPVPKETFDEWVAKKREQESEKAKGTTAAGIKLSAKFLRRTG